MTFHGVLRATIRTVAGAMALASTLTAVAPAQSGDWSARLRRQFGMTDSEIARLDRGEVVTQRPGGLSGDEVAFVGGVRLAVSASAAASRIFSADLPAASPSLIRRAGFSRPPSASDLRAYELPPADVDALRECVVGACVLKLPADAISAIRALDWKAENVAEQASAAMRAWLFAYVRGYAARGNEALVVYEDGRTPLPLHEGFHTLLAAMPFWADDAPEFHHYLDVFPRQPLSGVRDTITCYVEDFGLRPLTSVVHSSLYTVPERSGTTVRALVARKQIYASHYFRARLSMLAFVEGPSPSETYLVWLDRSLFDTKLNRFVRGRVEGKLEDDLRARLAQVQRTLSPLLR